MKKDKSTQGFGLAVFSLILLGLAFIGVLSGKKLCVIASIISILSVIFATAAYFEARRAKGARKFSLIALIISLIGTYLILIWTGTLKNISPFSNSLDQEEIRVLDTNINKADRLLEKAEEFEQDTSIVN